jgi:hypothetical protein
MVILFLRLWKSKKENQRKEGAMEQKISTTDSGKQKKSIFARIKCWFTPEESTCGGGPAKPSGDASKESKDGKVCSNGEIRL